MLIPPFSLLPKKEALINVIREERERREERGERERERERERREERERERDRRCKINVGRFRLFHLSVCVDGDCFYND